MTTYAITLRALGLRLHGFGVKTQGLQQAAHMLTSSDSMAWSRRARWIGEPALPECQGQKHKHCGNCLAFALHWRKELLDTLPLNWQDYDFDGALARATGLSVAELLG